MWHTCPSPWPFLIHHADDVSPTHDTPTVSSFHGFCNYNYELLGFSPFNYIFGKITLCDKIALWECRALHVALAMLTPIPRFHFIQHSSDEETIWAVRVFAGPMAKWFRVCEFRRACCVVWFLSDELGLDWRLFSRNRACYQVKPSHGHVTFSCGFTVYSMCKSAPLHWPDAGEAAFKLWFFIIFRLRVNNILHSR